MACMYPRDDRQYDFGRSRRQLGEKTVSSQALKAPNTREDTIHRSHIGPTGDAVSYMGKRRIQCTNRPIRKRGAAVAAVVPRV